MSMIRLRPARMSASNSLKNRHSQSGTMAAIPLRYRITMIGSSDSETIWHANPRWSRRWVIAIS